jgi:hypothetical protein
MNGVNQFQWLDLYLGLLNKYMRLITYPYVHCYFRICFKVVRMVELISPYFFYFLKLFSVLFTDWVNNPISSTFFKVTFFKV